MDNYTKTTIAMKASDLKKKIISLVVEAAVVVCMGTHVYSFGDKIYLQKRGGPIGMRFTASLANLVMKKWDQTKMLSKIKNLTFFTGVDAPFQPVPACPR